MELLLPILILLPLVGAVLCLLVPEAMAKGVALVTAVAVFLLTLPLLGVAFGGAPLAAQYAQLTGFGFGVRVGLDAVSFWLVLLTTFLMPLAVWSSFDSIKRGQRAYYFWLTALTSAMVGTFLARDGLLFYAFFELTLIPMFFLIGIWGGDERRYAAVKFFLYTFVGGVFTLAAIVYLGLVGGSFAFDDMVRTGQSIRDPTFKVLLFVALLAGFAVKVPLFPVHTWLPLAHTVAPTAGSVILAGVLLKLGTYGIFKLAIPMGLLSSPLVAGVGGDGLMPVMRDSVIPVVAVLCIVGIIYGALVAWVQEDVKKLVAYSSVSHLGFCVLGLIALTTAGVQGSVFYMINHGISTGALFLMIGMIYDRYHTRMFRDYQGLGKAMPVFSFFLVLFAMSSIGLPGTNGFVSEFLTIFGAFQSPYLGPWYGAFATIGVILGAVYMLHMVQRLVFGPLKLPDEHHGEDQGNGHVASHAHAGHSRDDGHGHGPAKAKDLTAREIAILTPLAILVLVLGLVPAPLLRSIEPGAQQARLPAGAEMVAQTDAPTDAPVLAEAGR